MRVPLVAVLALLAVAACGPTTQMYTVSGSRPQGLSTQHRALDVNLELCQTPRASPAPPEGAEQGFVELAPGCQLPMQSLGSRQPGSSRGHFALVGGPYRCTLNDNVGPLSIKGVDGTVTADDPILTLDCSDPYRGQDCGDRLQVVLRGTQDGSQRNGMVCGIPEKP